MSTRNLFFMLLVFAFSGQIFASATGQLEISEALTFNIEGKKLELTPGKHSATLELDYSPLSTDIIVLTIKNQKISMPITPETYQAFSSGKDFTASAKELKQKFSLRGKMDTEKLDTDTKIEQVSCTYCGYCFATTPEGKYEYGYNTSCSGNQQIETRLTRFKKTTKIEIILGERIIGSINLDPQISSKSKKVADVTDCK